MTGKGQQIISLLSGNTLASVQISRDFGSHGITAENPHKEGVSSLGRKSECPAPERSAPAKEFLQNLQVHKQRGQDKKGQHEGRSVKNHNISPSLPPEGTAWERTGADKKKRIKGRKEKARFIKIPRKSWDAFLCLTI